MAGNGLGPRWFPKCLRSMLTHTASYFFKTASWDIHDASYAKGEPRRTDCDNGFLRAMLKDASEAETPLKMLACSVLAWMLWLLVRLFGWTTFNYKRKGV